MKKLMTYSLFFVLLIGVATAQSQSIYYVANIWGVSQGQCTPTTFTLTNSTYITMITDYHWNGGGGSTPGTIGLMDQDNNVYGPWAATGSTYWVVNPGITVPAGTYTVLDSEMSTWSYNSQSGNVCFSWGEGYPNELPVEVPEFGLIASVAAAAGALGIIIYNRRR